MSADSSEPVICTCVEMTKSNFVAAIGRHPELDFEALMEKTGAGMRCTACRLDLELAYTENFGRLAEPSKQYKGAVSKVAPSLKAKFYAWLDRMAPMTSLRLSNTVPVLRQTGVRQHVVVCNDPPLYAKDMPLQAARVRIIVRDGEGCIRADQSHDVTVEQPLDIDVAAFLPQPANDMPGLGSVEVIRTWRKPASRGTTRPQIVIEAPGGCGAVHTTAPNGPGATWYSALARRGEDRVLLGVVNPSGRPLHVQFHYPYAPGHQASPRGEAILPPYGALLHEVLLDEAESVALFDKPFSMRCDADGAHKVYLFTASPALDRFSVDHPASG